MRQSKKTAEIGSQVGLIGIIISIIFAVLFGKAEAQTITQRDGYKAYAKEKILIIEVKQDMDHVEMWGIRRKKPRRLLNFTPQDQTLRINTTRLKKGEYTVKIFINETTKIVKFKV